MKPINFILIFLLCIGFISCDYQYEIPKKEKEKIVAVKTLTLKQEGKSVVKTAFGQLQSVENIQWFSRQSGRISTLKIKPGKMVKQGDLLLAYSIKNHHLQEEQATIELDKLSQDYKKQKQLFDSGAVSQQSVIEFKTQLDIQRKSLEMLRQIQIVQAPFSGEITEVFIKHNQDVEVGTPLFSLAQNQLLSVDFYLSGGEITKVNPGDKVYFMYGEERIEGQVYERSFQMEKNKKAYRVSARFDNTSGQVKTFGETVEVFIEGGQKKLGVWIPAESLVKVGKASFVYVVEKGKSVLKKVNTGFRTQSIVLVNSGINAGEEVVVAGMGKLKNGTSIKIIK